MIRNKQYSVKKRKTILNKILKLYSTGDYTIASCCAEAGVPYRTFKYWLTQYEKAVEEGKVTKEMDYLAKFAESYQDVKDEIKEVFHSELVQRAEMSLMKLVKGYEYEETVTEVKEKKDKDGTTILVPVGVKKTKKQSLPSTSAVTFVLTRLSPDKWGDSNKIVTNLNLNTSAYDNMTLDEINEELRKVREDIEEEDETTESGI